jgi:hypothetical protein
MLPTAIKEAVSAIARVQAGCMSEVSTLARHAHGQDVYVISERHKWLDVRRFDTLLTLSGHRRQRGGVGVTYQQLPTCLKHDKQGAEISGRPQLCELSLAFMVGCSAQAFMIDT